MSYPHFFPDFYFGWAFYLVLVGLTVVAAFIDFRSIRIPKELSLLTLGMGVLFNLIRGSWLGLEGEPVWIFGKNGPAVGALDGFLFSFAGFAVGFGLFFGMWILGACAGGDVKLFAALGTWLGPVFTFWVLVGTIFVLVPLSMLALAISLVRQGFGATIKDYSLQKGKMTKGRVQPRSRLMTYSLSIAVATAVVMLWFFRGDLLGVKPLATPVNQLTGTPTPGG